MLLGWEIRSRSGRNNDAVLEKGNAGVAARVSLVGPPAWLIGNSPIWRELVTHLGDWQSARVLGGLTRLRISKHAQPLERSLGAPGEAGAETYNCRFQGRANDDLILTL